MNTFGFTGPWRGRRGFDTVVQAASGMAHISGRGAEPKFMPVSALDYVSGYLLAFGIMVALTRRAQDGGSYRVNVALARTCEWLTAMGLCDEAIVDASADELAAEELKRLLVEVPSPLGRLTRLRPVINLSDGALQHLPPWRTAENAAAAWKSR